jgi:UDP-N-acetylmuramate dehydrogenase
MRHTTNLNLTEYNSYRIEAHCANAFFPETEEDLRYLYIERKHIPKILLGSGHNVILSKPYYEEDFVIFSGNFNKTEIIATTIIAESGANMIEVSERAQAHSLTGLEIFYDIPSSMGGAVVMNAGASGEEIKDVLIKVHYYDTKKNVFGELKKEKIGFQYRNSIFLQNSHLIVTKAWLELKHGQIDAIQEKMDYIKKARWAKQPRDFPNAGSVFKRPIGFYVGTMIEELGLKGYRVGGAMISEKHAGFILNFDNATGEDILKLIELCQRKVSNSFNVELEVEQRVI